MFEATKIIHQNSDWITLVLLFIFGVLSMLKIVYKDKLFHVSTFFYSKKYLSIYYNKEKRSFFNLLQVSFFTIQLLAISLLFYLVNINFQLHPKLVNFNGYILLFSFIGSYFVLRYFLGILLAFLFNFKEVHSKIVTIK